MKRAFTFLLLCLAIIKTEAQITYNFSTPPLFLDKFHVSGYKHVNVNFSTKQINIYNLNNTLFKNITIPATAYPVTGLYYLSENLFDSDNGMEYAVQTSTTIVNSSSSTTYFCAAYVFDESGSTLFYRDSGQVGAGGAANVFQNFDMIYWDGVSTKMKVGIYGLQKWEVYSIPGTIPCVGCTSGIVSMVSGSGVQVVGEAAEFFPNPVVDQLKLKYKLPPGSKQADIKIHDLSGRLVDELKITDDFDFIYLPSNYNNGMYLYSLIVDGTIIKTEKIVLQK